MQFRVNLSEATPPFRQIVDIILDAVATNRLAVGDRLPSIREVATEAMVNPNTASKAYRELTLRGVILIKKGTGAYVTREAPKVAQALRAEATLEEFTRCASLALRAGHDRMTLLNALAELCDLAPVPTEGPSS